MDVIELPAACGAILGTLFSADLSAKTSSHAPLIDERQARDMVRTRGAELRDRYWGAYMAFLSDRGGTAHYLLRDCSGKLPCYRLTIEGVAVLTANIGDLSGLPIPSFSMNKQYLAGFIYSTEMSHRECALNEVTELLAGECLELNDGAERQYALWNPHEICRQDSFEDFQDAARQVRTVTQACVDLWASKYDRIIHMLSGGLDSSVVLGCLARSGKPSSITCLHLETDGPGESERAYAHIAAAAAKKELLVQPGYSQNSRYDERIHRLPLSPKPSVSNLGVTVEADFRNQIPSQIRAEAIWDGQGGDHLFFESCAAFSAIDYAFVHGVGRGFSRHARNAIRRSGLSVWSVVDKSLRLGVFGSRWHPEDEYSRSIIFVNRDVLPREISEYVWQPWLAEASDLPPGKRLQIRLINSLVHRHRPVPELQYAPEHHPLFAQPLMDLCLRIPIYTLLLGGVDRSLERAAFRECVPGEIIRREGKGTVSSSLMSKVRECPGFLRDLLLDGVLVSEGIIDRASLAPFLLAGRPVNSKEFWPFLSCIAAEVWARKWADTKWLV